MLCLSSNNALTNYTPRPVTAPFVLYFTLFPNCCATSPNDSVDIHVNDADEFQLDSCAPPSPFPLNDWHPKSVLPITPRVLSANCSLYGWAELIAKTFPLSDAFWRATKHRQISRLCEFSASSCLTTTSE